MLFFNSYTSSNYKKRDLIDGYYDKIIKISREILKKPHNIIILKGKDAQDEINNLSMDQNYSYKLKRSMTDIKSKIIIFQVKK